MLWFYLNSPLVASIFDVCKCDGKHCGKTQKAVDIQLHQAKNEQPQGEKLQNRASNIDTNPIESFDCHLGVIRPALIAKSKGERSFEVHQVEPQERRRSSRRHDVDSQPPKMRRNRPESDLSTKQENDGPCLSHFLFGTYLRGWCYRKYQSKIIGTLPEFAAFPPYF